MPFAESDVHFEGVKRIQSGYNALDCAFEYLGLRGAAPYYEQKNMFAVVLPPPNLHEKIDLFVRRFGDPRLSPRLGQREAPGFLRR